MPGVDSAFRIWVQAKVADFGLLKSSTLDGNVGATRVAGTPGYMDPVGTSIQAHSRERHTDVGCMFCANLCLFEKLCLYGEVGDIQRG